MNSISETATSSSPVPLEDKIRGAAFRLRTAMIERRPCAPVRHLLGTTDMSTGYAVQELLTASAVRDGRRTVGRKIGLTSPVVQQQLGVDQPDFGVLFDDMVRSETTTIDPSTLLQPKIEAEIAFVLSHDLDQPGPDCGDITSAVDHVVPALEIVDSRIADWDISIVDTVADNASSGLFVLGANRQPLDGLDLPSITMTLTANGEEVSHGTGAACLNDPLNALLWLANTARKFGTPLRAGDVVLSGALGPMVPVRPDTRYEAELSELGTVTALFGREAD